MASTKCRTATETSTRISTLKLTYKGTQTHTHTHTQVGRTRYLQCTSLEFNMGFRENQEK